MSDQTFTKADLDAAIAKVTATFEERIDAIDAKKNEALEEAKKAKAELRKVKEINPDDFTALEAERDDLRAKLTAAEKQAKDAAKAAETATKALESESGFTRQLLVENGLREALAANGVTNAVHQKAAMAMLASGVEIAQDGGSRVAKVGDKALADYVKEWAGSEEGKHFVAAPANGGGGAPGGASGGNVKTMDRASYQTLMTSDPAKANNFVREGGQIVDQAA